MVVQDAVGMVVLDTSIRGTTPVFVVMLAGFMASKLPRKERACDLPQPFTTLEFCFKLLVYIATISRGLRTVNNTYNIVGPFDN